MYWLHEWIAVTGTIFPVFLLAFVRVCVDGLGWIEERAGAGKLPQL